MKALLEFIRNPNPYFRALKILHLAFSSREDVVIVARASDNCQSSRVNKKHSPAGNVHRGLIGPDALKEKRFIAWYINEIDFRNNRKCNY